MCIRDSFQGTDDTRLAVVEAGAADGVQVGAGDQLGGVRVGAGQQAPHQTRCVLPDGESGLLHQLFDAVRAFAVLRGVAEAGGALLPLFRNQG